MKSTLRASMILSCLYQRDVNYESPSTFAANKFCTTKTAENALLNLALYGGVKVF